MHPSQDLSVAAQADFVPQQSDPDNKRYVFSYTITIKNSSNRACQLLSRHWVIQDSNHKTEEVYGEGVVGEQPIIKPGETYSYTSGAILETEMGTMEGRYFMIDAVEEGGDDIELKNEQFEISVPKFLLSIPRVLH